jgi:RNA polymerase sigma-70 factor (ECF subfamily)
VWKRIAVDELASLVALMPRRSELERREAASAFTANVDPHVATMLRLARRLGRDDAEDIVQEALARAWAKRSQFDPARGSFGAWLLAITADQAYKSWRWHRRHAAPPAAARTEAPPDALLDLERSIPKLSRRQRLAVDCFYFAGLSVAETAAVMGCSEGTVKSTLSDARSALRGLLR